MHVLIIGGTGFIGPSVVSALSAAGHRVTVLHRGETEADLGPEVGVIRGDRDALAAALDGFRADVAVHMITATAQDAWSARRALSGVVDGLVLVSSVDVYAAYGRLLGIEAGEPEPEPIREDSPLRSRLYPYRDPAVLPWLDRAALPPERLRRLEDYDKILVERVLLEGRGLPTSVLRLPLVFGPRDGQHRLYSALRRMDDGRPAILLAEEAAAWRSARAYVDDVGVAIARLATRRPFLAGRCLNVAYPDNLDERRWLEAVAEVVGWDGAIIEVPMAKMPSHLASEHDFRHHLAVDAEATRRLLELPAATPLREAIATTVAWQRSQTPQSTAPDTFDYAAEDAALEVP